MELLKVVASNMLRNLTTVYEDLMLRIRDLLNKILWAEKERKSEYEITFLHRGAYMDRKKVPFNSVIQVGAGWFSYADPTEGEVQIPFHRIMEIRNIKNGRIVWNKRKQETNIH
jgi:hypothetical protein